MSAELMRLAVQIRGGELLDAGAGGRHQPEKARLRPAANGPYLVLTSIQCHEEKCRD